MSAKSIIPSHINFKFYILFVLVFIEIICHVLPSKTIDNDTRSLIYLSVGLIFPLLIWNWKSTLKVKHHPADFLSPAWIWGAALILGLVTQHYMELVIAECELDYRLADMLPIMQIMSERYLSDISPYEIIPEIWDGMQPIYLPAMWLPMVITVAMDLDARWATWAMTFIGSLFILRPWINAQRYLPAFVMNYVLILLLWICFLIIDYQVFGYTEEGIVFGYYLFLCWSLIRKKGVLIGIAAGLCLMSRYSLGPWWIILCVITLIVNEKKLFIQMALTCMVTIIVIMTMGKAWGHLPTFLSEPDKYLVSILDYPSKYAELVQSSLGIAKFWSYEKLGTLHHLMKIGAFLVPLLCAFKFYFSNDRIDWCLFALLSLKFSLVVFYNLLIMPYPYLFYTSTIVSVFILAYLSTEFESTKDIRNLTTKI